MCFAFNHKIFSVENMIYIFLRLKIFPLLDIVSVWGETGATALAVQPPWICLGFGTVIAARVGHGPQLSFQMELKSITLRHTRNVCSPVPTPDPNASVHRLWNGWAPCCLSASVTCSDVTWPSVALCALIRQRRQEGRATCLSVSDAHIPTAEQEEPDTKEEWAPCAQRSKAASGASAVRSQQSDGLWQELSSMGSWTLVVQLLSRVQLFGRPWTAAR